MVLLKSINELSIKEGLVSVIVPMFNSSSTIKKCIDSFLEQTYPDFELIIVDNGSTDDSYAVCEPYQAKDSRIRLLKADRKGVSYARNFGLERSCGEYIVFHDSDDYVDRSFLQKMLDAIKKNDCKLAMCNFIIEKGQQKKEDRSLTGYNSVETYKTILNRILYCKTDGYCWGNIWRRDAVVYGFAPYTYAEDAFFLFSNISATSGDVAIVEEPLYYYCRNANSITAVADDYEMFDSLKVAKRIITTTERSLTEYLKPAYSYLINFAFYAYLTDKKGNEKFCKKIDRYSVKLIRKYRSRVLFDPKATLKTKAACILSLFSMKLVKAVYSRLK